MSYVDEILERVAKENPGQPEFLQAVIYQYLGNVQRLL